MHKDFKIILNLTKAYETEDGCAFVVGGTVAGGRVLGDWPGLGSRDLYEARDLRATTDLRALFKAVLLERFGVSEGALASSVFPSSDAIQPLEGITAP